MLAVVSIVCSRSSDNDVSNLSFGNTSTLVGNECDKAQKNLVITKIRVI